MNQIDEAMKLAMDIADSKSPKVHAEAQLFVSMSERLHAVSTGEMERICHCGTCAEALEAAYRLYDQLRQNHCGFWPSQIVQGLHLMLQIEDAARLGITLEELRTTKEGAGAIPPERKAEMDLLATLSSKVDGVMDHLLGIYANDAAPKAIHEMVKSVEERIYAARPNWHGSKQD